MCVCVRTLFYDSWWVDPWKKNGGFLQIALGQLVIRIFKNYIRYPPYIAKQPIQVGFKT